MALNKVALIIFEETDSEEILDEQGTNQGGNFKSNLRIWMRCADFVSVEGGVQERRISGTVITSK